MNREERVVAGASSQREIDVRKRFARRLSLAARHLLPLLLIFGLVPDSAFAMPNGFARGCARPIYGSADAVCAVSLELPGSFFTIDLAAGRCSYFNSAGAPISQQIFCADCPAGSRLDAGIRCVPTAAIDPFANAGSHVQPALSAAGPPAVLDDPIFVANPINAQTGNRYQRDVDFEGLGAFPLAFIRHYNSVFTYQSQLG